MSNETELTTLGEVRKVLRMNNPWLASEDLDGGDLDVTIASVKRHDEAQFEDGKRTVVALHFEGDHKALVLNNTNTETLLERFGKNVQDWKGQTISLTAAKLAQKAFGRSHGVRIK